MPGGVQLILLLALLWTSAFASHFRGAIIMVRPQPGGTEYEMEIFYHISWRRNALPGSRCESSSTVSSGTLLQGEGSLTCAMGCSGKIADMDYICTSFSDEWSFGEHRLVHNFTQSVGERVTIVYTGQAWIFPYDTDHWYIPTNFALTKRNDTGRINSTPRAITAPVIQLQEGCNHTISLAVSDPDNDIIRCRWAEGFNECGGICNKFLGAELDSDSCTITYQANMGAGYRVAALIIEDFIPNSSLPLSSVALQFLVLVVSSTEPCSQQPEFIPPTIRQGSCVAVPPGTTFYTQLAANSNNLNILIEKFETVSPRGTSEGEINHVEGSSVYFVNITWTPDTIQQNQTHMFCFTAVNSNQLSSEQTCIQLFTGHFPPMPIQASATPNQQLVNPSNTTWHVQFDTDIERPSMVAYITFHEFNTGDEVYKIDTSLSLEVTFEQSNAISITPNHFFAEKGTFYITFARAVVQGLQGCRPGNEPISEKDFWIFETKDITPPNITFLENPSVSNANISFLWESNENVTWQCKLINATSEFEFNCSEAYWKGYLLDEGQYSLCVEATDEAGNTAKVIHAFEIDLTPPTLSILQKPALLSNQLTTTLRFACNEACILECQFFNQLVSEENFFPCNQGMFVTPTLEHNNTYTFSVTATDQVGNKGKTLTYVWQTDFEIPHVYGIQNVSVSCNDINPNYTGQAQAIDSTTKVISLMYVDMHLGCSIRRTWTATDEAGNVDHLVQYIGLEFSPTLSVSPQVAFQCDSMASSIQVPTTMASALNPCNLPMQLTYEDSVSENMCPSNFTRTWTIEICDRNTSSSQTIILYDVCPLNACGRNETTPRGICTFGECQCNAPWHGEDCSVLIYEPRLESVVDTVLLEAQEYTTTVILSQGSPPLSWTLLSGPDELIVDQYTGQVTWNRAQAGNHTVSVQVENQVGKAQVAWILQVKPGYSAVLHPVSPRVFPRAQPVELTGQVEYAADSLVEGFLAGIVPVYIDITSNGIKRTVTTLTSMDGRFSTVFYPVATEYGSYIAGARNPGSLHIEPQTEWGFLGMKAIPQLIFLNQETIGIFQETFYNATVVYNDGPATLHEIIATSPLAQANSENLSIYLFLQGTSSNVTLEPGSSALMDIKIVASGPLSARFSIILEATNGTTLNLTVNLQIEASQPSFLIHPSSVNRRIIRGESKVFEFNVTNIGRGIAHSLQAIVPETNVFSFVSFGNSQQSEGNLILENKESAILSVLTQLPANYQLGEITATIGITSREVSEFIVITLTVSSNALMNLTVTVEDEYTYFIVPERPSVNNAAITLINYQQNVRITQTTELGNGTATFTEIQEDRYEMLVEAPGHRSIHQIIITSIEMPSLTVFIQRQAVTYTWSVTPVTFEDIYILTIEADFQTHVPIPVVTVTPTEVNLDMLERGLIDSIQINVTNHGLIRAHGVSLQLPADHPFLEFTANKDDLGDLEPLSSVIVTVQTNTKKISKRNFVTWTVYLINVVYHYICGGRQIRNIPVVLKQPVYHLCGTTSHADITGDIEIGGGFELSFGTEGVDPFVFEIHLPVCTQSLDCSADGGSGGGSIFSFRGYSAKTPGYCEKCLQSIISCFPTPSFPFSGCIPLVVSGVNPLNSISDAISWILCVVDIKWLGRAECIYGIYKNCLTPTAGNRKRRDLRNAVNEVVEAMYPIHQSIALGIEVLGDEVWLSVGDPSWVSHVLRPAFDDTSEAGVLISSTEFSAILAAPLPNKTTLETVARMVERLNNTIYGWNNSQLEPQAGFNMASFNKVLEFTRNIKSYNDRAKSKGFSSYLDSYNFASNELNTLNQWPEEEAGVCAIVRIRIEQELAVSREAFLAKLEIENQEDSPLEQIELEIVITDPISGEAATHLFSISNETLSGSLRSVDGKWSLPSKMSGAAEWHIVPYSEAAQISSYVYDVGGTLLYSLDSEGITIPLFPTKITVIPDPSLHVHYFWEKTVIGDDPFTDEVESSVPFTLGVAVRNAGYGTANNLQITSGNPKIIENSKGLLVNFMIVGANIGSKNISPSLTVSFGDIAPNTTKVARWFMISSLKGEFKNYSATFENINPLGDPKLSILDELEVHELIRNVMIYNSTEEDGILDFLVNERKDILEYPDALYSSKTLQRYEVSAGTVLLVELTSTRAASIEVMIRTSTNSTGWVYYGYEDTQGILKEAVSTVNGAKQEGNAIPPENSWITRLDLRDSTMDTKIEYLHIVDYAETTDDVVYIVNLCTSNCPTEERPFQMPIIANLNSSSAVVPVATLVPTRATMATTLAQSVTGSFEVSVTIATSTMARSFIAAATVPNEVTIAQILSSPVIMETAKIGFSTSSSYSATTVATSVTTDTPVKSLSSSLSLTIASLTTSAPSTASIGAVMPTEASSEETAKTKFIIAISVAVPIASVVIIVGVVAIALGRMHTLRTRRYKPTEPNLRLRLLPQGQDD